MPQLVVPAHAVLWLADDDHFLLLELVDAVNASLLNAVGTLLLAEAGAVAGQGQGQLGAVQGLVNETADHGVLRSADQVQVLTLDLVHHGIHFGEGHNALHHIAVHHERGDDIGEALVDHKIAGVSQNSFVQAGNVAQQIVEAVAGNAACSIQVNAVKAFHDVNMVRDGIIRHNRIAKALYFHIVAVVRADGHTGVNHLRDGVHDVADLVLQLGFLGFQLFQAVSLCGHLLLDLLGFGGLAGVLFSLAHQHADLLGKLVAVGAQGVTLANGGAVLGIQIDDLVYQRQLGILKLLFNVLLDLIGVLTHKTNIQHDSKSFPLFVILQMPEI